MRADQGGHLSPPSPLSCEHTSSFVTRDRYNVQTVGITTELVKVNLLDTSGLNVDRVISFQSDFHSYLYSLPHLNAQNVSLGEKR